MKDGRPLRFLGGTLGGWALFRIAVLWPGAEMLPLGALVHRVLPPSVARPFVSLSATAVDSPAVSSPAPIARDVAFGPSPPSPSPTIVALPPTIRQAAAQRASPPPTLGAIGPPLRPTPIAHGPGRLAGSAWTLVRGGPSGTLSGGQLGASQAGIRLTYALGHARRLALAVRFATPLSGPGKEAAIGVEWKPTRLPFRLIAEQRFVLDGGRGGPTIGIIGGYGPGFVAPGVRIEAYGQAGAIARNGVEGFVDAAARATHPVVEHGPVRVDIGAGVWGSAQRGAARLDLGPTIGAAVSLGHRTVRLSADCGIM